jgi:DNA-binding FadR family transcriptional regulator
MTSQLAASHETLRQPHLAELIATELRSSILRGDLHDGELLPTQDELCVRFSVGKVTIREALRILENEGLVTVRRGNTGGATVHAPALRFAARMLAMVMEARTVTASQLAVTLQEMEPLCAAMCANNPDRMSTVVPELRTLLDASKEALPDPVEFTRLSRQFHETMVGGCGNEAMIIVVGALESIWSPGAEGWARRAARSDSYPDTSGRRSAWQTHQRLISLIADGKAELASRLAREHVTSAQRYSLGADPYRRVTLAEFG